MKRFESSQHHHKELNFGLYGCFDCLCGTRYRPGYNPSLRGLAMNRFLQFDDVYTRDDLSKGLAAMRGTPVMAALREEVAACRAREGGVMPAVHEADTDVAAGDEVADGTEFSEDLGVQEANVLPYANESDDESDGDHGGAEMATRKRSSTPTRRSR